MSYAQVARSNLVIYCYADDMRTEPRGVGSIVHATQRGVRGSAITRDTWDQNHFRKLLFYPNDTFSDQNWLKSIQTCAPFERPPHWPERDPLVRVLAWTLMPNHFHLLLEEIREHGIAKFMQRLCGSMSMTFNAKYNERGSLFQGSYKSKTVDDDTYLRYLAYYIQVKNVLELYPGGLRTAVQNFDDAWEWALRYPFSSLSAYAANTASPIVDTNRFLEIFPDAGLSKDEALEMLLLHMESHDEKYDNLALEPW